MMDARVVSADQVIRGVKNPSHVGLAGRLKAARKQACDTRQSLAQRAGVANGVIHGIEEEGVIPLLDTVELLARALGMSPCILAYNIQAAPPQGAALACAAVGARLQQIRTARGASRKGLGKLAALSTTAISNIEDKGHMPSVATVEKLAKALGCDPCWLAYGAGTAPDLTPPAA